MTDASEFSPSPGPTVAAGSAGARFRLALEEEQPLQIPGAINAYCALLAARAGFRAIYVSGAGIANASLGLPDLGLIGLGDVATDIHRIAAVCSLPVLVDVDTGLGPALAVSRTVRELCRLGAAGVQLEDQVSEKRCGHRSGKALVSPDEMVRRLELAAASRPDPDFVLVARTDALATEGRQGVLTRAKRYRDAGADILFLEAARSADDYRAVGDEVDLPILANMTEFGVTPLLSLEELREAGVAAVIYPLTAFRALAAAATRAYDALRTTGSQHSVLSALQPRTELYDVLDYERAEATIDRFLAVGGESPGTSPAAQ